MSYVGIRALRPEEELVNPDCIERKLKACKGEPFFAEHAGNRYCVLHFPGPNKRRAFDEAVKRKLKSNDYNYQRIWFPTGTWFHGLETSQPVDFSFAVFNDAVSFFQTKFTADTKFEATTFDEEARFE